MVDESLSRKEYVDACKEQAKRLIFEENLPQASDFLKFKLTGKASNKLQHIFDIFENEEEVAELLKRENYRYSEEESKQFLDSVIAANVKEISKNGILYQQLLAAGDNYVVVDDICENKGRKIKTPNTKEDFIYEVRDMYVSFDSKTYTIFHDFEDFIKAAKNKKEIWVKSPMNCKHMSEHKVCKECAGKLDEKITYIGAFATMMVTEAATQDALSSMNKGVKENINTLIGETSDVNSVGEFINWADVILEKMRGDKVERRWYEIALASRLIKTKDEYKVKKLSEGQISDSSLYGNFIYKPTDKNYRKLVSAGSFTDDSLQTRIAFCDF